MDEILPEVNIFDDRISEILEHASVSDSGVVSITRLSDVTCMSSKVSRFKEAVFHGVVAKEDIFDLQSKYGAVAKFVFHASHLISGESRKDIGRYASAQWYQYANETPFPTGTTCPQTLFRRSGQSNVYFLCNEKSEPKLVLKILRSRLLNGANLDEVFSGYATEFHLHQLLFQGIDICFPEENYFVLKDPRTGIPTVGIIQDYVSGLIDIFDIKIEDLYDLPNASEVIKFFKRLILIYKTYSVLPDILGKCNFCIDIDGNLMNIDPHNIIKLGKNPERDARLLKKFQYMETAIRNSIQLEFQKF